METLRKLSHLSPQNFKPPGKTDKATVIRTDTYASKPLQHDRQQVPSHEVLNHLASLAAKNTGSQASLLIVTFPRDSRDYIYTTYELFMTLFNSFGIEPRLLDSLRLNRYGFYAENSNENVASYYICARRFTILWSFDAEKCATRGVMLIHQDNWLDSATQAFDNFMNIMTLEKNKIRSPILLTWCMLVDTMSWLDASIYAALNHARALERQTGHGPHAGASTGFDKSSDIDGLRQASQVVGKLVVVLTNLFRHVKICMEIASFLEEVIDQGSQYPTDEAQKMRLSELKHFAATIPEIRKKLDDAGTTLDYIQGRFNNQSSVIYALMTHADARANMDIAQASAEIASATGKDSSAMKTIATMTMAFLPATFFAALFAVPSLKWDESSVIQDKFWVYWAFTIPCTAAVFLVQMYLSGGFHMK